MAEEIDQSRAAVAAEAPDWLIVDHYALDAEWERAMASECCRIMVIDDLADRPHACDLLLDQGLANQPSNYFTLIHNQALMLLGPTFALLRPEFGLLRPAAEARDRTWPPGRILVNLGGTDTDNATSAVLDTLSRFGLPATCAIDVVMGRNAPHMAEVSAAAVASRLDVQVSADVTDMGVRMLTADLAIGAAGTTSWERACLGLPSLTLSIAENQLGVAEALDAAGAAVNLGPLWEPGWPTRLLTGLEALSVPGRLREISGTCRTLVDGAGTSRVVRALTALPLAMRPCSPEDAERVWLWREADSAPRFYRSRKPTSWETHQGWFEAALEDPRRALFIVEQDGRPVAHLRFDFPDTGRAEVGLAVDPGLKGTGLGLGTVAAAVRHARLMGWLELSAEVHEKNTASALIFERNGFRQVGRSGAFLLYQIDIEKGALA